VGKKLEGGLGGSWPPQNIDRFNAGRNPRESIPLPVHKRSCRVG